MDFHTMATRLVKKNTDDVSSRNRLRNEFHKKINKTVESVEMV